MDPEDAPTPEEVAFAERVRKLREERGWSQTELAERLRDAGLNYMTQPMVSRIEQQARSVHLAEALVLAKTYGRSVEEMVSPDFGVAMLRIRRTQADMLGAVLDEFQNTATMTELAKVEANEQLEWVEKEWRDFEDKEMPQARYQYEAAKTSLMRLRDAELADVLPKAAFDARGLWGSDMRVRMMNGHAEAFHKEAF